MRTATLTAFSPLAVKRLVLLRAKSALLSGIELPLEGN